MPSWKKVITSGSSAHLNELTSSTFLVDGNKSGQFIAVIDNDENIILEATKEFLDRVNNNFFETEEDLILQKKFTSLLKSGHYGFGTSGKISTMFLRKYRYLL